MNINTNYTGCCLCTSYDFAFKHFQIAFAKQENIQELWQNQVINNCREDLPSLQISLCDRIRHFILGVLELLIPIVGCIIAFVEAIFVSPRPIEPDGPGTNPQQGQTSPLTNPLPTHHSPPYKLFGSVDENGDERFLSLISDLTQLDAMDKRTMSGSCDAQTTRMENFLHENFGMVNIPQTYFVQGVKAFSIRSSVKDLPEDAILEFKGEDGATFRMSKTELLQWQNSYRIFADRNIYSNKTDGLDKRLLRKSLQGRFKDEEDNWKMKFVVRISENPILTEFDGKVIDRYPNDQDQRGKVYLASVCGIDFAGRKHDIKDIQHYIRNWDKVYQVDRMGELLVEGGRDFIPTGVPAILNENRLFHVFKRLIQLRLSVQDQCGIEVVVESAIGLGVFAGDRIGIGDEVRRLYVRAFKEALTGMQFHHIRLICLAMPIFKQSRDNYHYFEDGLEGYSGQTAILLLDQDMNKIANTCSAARFISCELNPADSHGIVGEYWQNRGPGTEEKLALTTLALLTQHHVFNPHVLSEDNYLELSGYYD